MKSAHYGEDAVHEWLEFANPDEPGDFIRVNVSLMLSNYNCIYGAGCPSIKAKDIPNASIGCCSQGVGFTDEDDFAHVAEQVAKLTDADCANLDHVQTKGWFVSNKHGPYKTRKKGSACIFANPEPTKPGDPPMGCSFHVLAQRLGVSHIETKPETCWKVPISDHFETTLNGERNIHVITCQGVEEWGGDPIDLLGEGPEEGDDPFRTNYLAYWCMESPDAFNGSEAFYIYAADELTEIIGANAYAKLWELMQQYGERRFKMPGELVNGGQPVIATLTSVIQSLRNKESAS